MKILKLTLKKKWFDMISTGEKIEEYREIKPYFVSRLFEVVKPIDIGGWRSGKIQDMFAFCQGYKGSRYKAIEFMVNEGYIKPRDYDAVQLRNGYNPDSPVITVQHKCTWIGKAVPEWSDNWQGEVFIISILKFK